MPPWNGEPFQGDLITSGYIRLNSDSSLAKWSVMPELYRYNSTSVMSNSNP